MSVVLTLAQPPHVTLAPSGAAPTCFLEVTGGPPGPRGRDGTASFPTIAAATLSGHRAVKAVVGGVGYPDLGAPADGDLILGITDGAADEGETIQVQAGGLMIEPSWSWALGPVFAGDAGHLTQIPPAGSWLRQIGTAVAPDRIIISLRPTILTITT